MEAPRTDSADGGEQPSPPDERTPAPTTGSTPGDAGSEEDLTEPALGGPKDDPQEAIAAHSGMWWPPVVEPEPAPGQEEALEPESKRGGVQPDPTEP
jgi:hypothetical protein